MINAAKRTSVKVPKSAPSINGIALLNPINLVTANGTNNPIVMLEENKIAVNKAPIKYALYLDSKCLSIKLLAFSSPPKTPITAFPTYLNEKIRIANPNIKINILLLLLNKGLIIGEVITPTKSGIFNKEIFPLILDAKKIEVFEKNLKKYSNKNAIITKSAL